MAGRVPKAHRPSTLSRLAVEVVGDVPATMQDEIEDDDESCTIGRPVFVVSDCTGESAERTVHCALGQFGLCFQRSCEADISVFRFVNMGDIEDIVRQAHEREAFVVFTLVDPAANHFMVDCCKKHAVKHHDLWSGLLHKLERYFDARSLGVPGRRQYVDEKYMHLIDCIEYTRTLDDGVNPKRWSEADMIIVGPSRSGKTPLAFFLAQRGFKVANYPLVPDEDIPRELFDFDQSRIFALIIEPRKLSSIRHSRMMTLHMGANSSYAKMANVLQEVDWCRALYKKNPKWNVIDTTETGIEENAARMLMIMDHLGNKGRILSGDNPSAI